MRDISAVLNRFKLLAEAKANHIRRTVTYSPAHILTALTSQKGLTISRNISYGPDERHVLDIYSPDGSTATQSASGWPVLLFIHGGSWQSGDKDSHGFVGRSLAQAGYLTVLINYRLAPKHVYPAYIEDAVTALNWVFEEVSAYGGDPTSIFVMGHSAGAFNAVIAVDDARYWAASRVPSHAIKGVIGIAGPYNYDFRHFQTKIAFPEGADPDDIMPDRHVRNDAPPHYLLVAENDELVGIKSLLRMQNGLEKAGVPYQTDTVNGAGHLSVIVALATPTRRMGNTRQMILDYLAAQLAITQSDAQDAAVIS